MTLSIKPAETNAQRQLFIRRVTAYFIDMTLLTIAIQAAQWSLFALTGGFPYTRLGETNNGWLIYGWVLLTVSLPIWLYFVLFERSQRRATPGKRLLGLQVIAPDNHKATLGQLWSRTLLKLVPWEIFHLTFMLPIPIMNDPTAAFRPGFLVGFVVLGLYLLVLVRTPAQQSIHDLIAKTRVVKSGRLVNE